LLGKYEPREFGSRSDSYGTKRALAETNRIPIDVTCRNLCLTKFRSQKALNPALTARKIKDAPDVRLGVTNGAINAAHRGKADPQIMATLATNIHRIVWSKTKRDAFE
jgi:hypothetical protein